MSTPKFLITLPFKTLPLTLQFHFPNAASRMLLLLLESSSVTGTLCIQALFDNKSWPQLGFLPFTNFFEQVNLLKVMESLQGKLERKKDLFRTLSHTF